MYKLGLPQERQLTTPRLVDDHPRPEFSHPEVRGCPPQDQQMTDHPSRPPAKALVAKGLSTGKRDSFHCLILRHFSMHARNNLSEKLQRKIDKRTRYRMWGMFC